MSRGFPEEKFARLRDPERLATLRLDEVMSRVVEPGMTAALDIGAGTGVYSEALLAAGLETVYAVDESEFMLEELKRQVPGAETLPCEADRIPLPADAVDLTIAAFMLHEVPDYLAALREWRRRTRRRVAVIEWPHPRDNSEAEVNHPMTPTRVRTLGHDAKLGECAIWHAGDWVLYIWDVSQQ